MADDNKPQVLLETTSGIFCWSLILKKLRKQWKIFLKYVDEGFYDNTIFHRVIPNFMIQGGGMDAKMKEKSTHEPIPNEADNGLKNERGSVAMARTADPHSASAQFFINHADNDFLNHREPTRDGWGYAVFGKVTDGMDVVDKIAKLKTRSQGIHDDVPVDMVLITKASRFN